MLLLLAPFVIKAQVQTEAEIQQIPKPAYCDEPALTATRAAVPAGSAPVPVMAEYPTLPTVCYKVQVAILRQSNPYDFRFHPSLMARWRPCEQVWVVESKATYCDRAEAEVVQARLNELGYTDTFLTQLVTYQ